MRTNCFMSAVLALGLVAAVPAVSQDKPQDKTQAQKAPASKNDTKAGTKRVDTPIIVLVPFAYGTDET